MPVEVYNRYKKTTIDNWQYGYESLGFIKSLALDCLREPFIMPLFAVQENNRTEITCGLSRFAANLTNGVAADNIPLILLTKDTPVYPGWQEINSTQQFTELFNLNDVDHEISLDLTKSFPIVTRSVIRHSVYDYINQAVQHAGMDDLIKRFWKKFVTDDKINITIFCTESTRPFVQDSPWCNITFMIQKSSEWEFSFGRLLGAYKPDQDKPNKSPELYLWLFDITEPVHLHLLFLWATVDVATYYSENKKSVLIDTSHKTSTAIIGNWVK